MTDYEKLLKKWRKLEDELIILIAKTDDEKLHEVFLEWQEIRNELNENTEAFWKDLIDKANSSSK